MFILTFLAKMVTLPYGLVDLIFFQQKGYTAGIKISFYVTLIERPLLNHSLGTSSTLHEHHTLKLAIFKCLFSGLKLPHSKHLIS